MKPKVLLFFIIALVYCCSSENTTKTSLTDYIPKNTAVVIKIKNVDSLKNSLAENKILSKITSWDSYKKFASKTSILKTLPKNSSGILCFTELDKGKIECTFITASVENLVPTDRTVETMTYKNEEIKKIFTNDTVYYAYQTKQTSFLCSSKAMAEKIIKDQEKTNTNPTLARLYQKLNAKKNTGIILHLEKCAPLIAPLLKEESVLNSSKFADWVSLDLKLNQNKILLNGISIAGDSIPKYLNLFKHTNAVKNKISKIAPIQSEAIQSYSFDDYATFSKNQQQFLKRSAKPDSLFSTVEEVGFVHLKNEKVIILHTYGAENMYDYLTTNKKESYDFQGNEILELKDPALLRKNLATVIKDYDASFCTVLEDAFVFSSKKDILQTIIKNYKNGATFNKSPLYVCSNSNLAEESSSLYISGAKNLEQLLQKHGTKTLYQEFKKSDFSKVGFTLQTVVDGDFYHTNINLLPIEKTKNNTKVTPLFSLQLKDEIILDPQFVTNHNSKKKEILVQDIHNVLYLISDTGHVLWKKELPSPIQGKVHQVDLYKNGRLQFAFTTAHKFLILDRNGKEVPPFTKAYEGATLNPLAVFDYESKKDYRFLVTQGKNIFMYNPKGEIVKGFKLAKTSENIIGAPKHFSIHKKDYLVFKLEKGILKIVNRVGKDRVSIKHKIDFSENEVYVYKERFNVTDTDGILHQINTEGKDRKTSLSLVKDHGLATTSKTLVYMNDNILSIKGKKVSLDLGVYSKPQIFFFRNKMYISVVDIQNQNVYLFDSLANLIPNFPVFGTSAIDLADLDGDKKPELVTKDNTNSIVVYKLY